LRKERASFLRSTAKNKSATPLYLSASALRHVVVAGMRTIKGTTVEFIVNTITEMISRKDHGNASLVPLIQDITKTLRALFDYQPHMERLSKDCWDGAVDFCIEMSCITLTVPDVEPTNSYSTSVSSRGRTPFDSTDASVTRASPHESRVGNKPVSDGFPPSIEDFVPCLHALVKASNAPLLDKAETIVTGLLNFLQRRIGRGHAAASALAAINAILTRTALQSLNLTKSTIRRLLPLMKDMWSEIVLRDELLITLTYTELSISSLLADTEDESTSLDLEVLIESIYSDYRSRQITTLHQFLEEDNLCFRHLGRANIDTHPLNTCVFSMETEHLRFEGLWATVSTVACFSFMLDKKRRGASSEREDDTGSMPKRVRVTQLFREYLRHIVEPRSNAKRAALQVVAFMVQEGPVDADDLQYLLEKLTSCISDENVVHSVWAMIGLAALVLVEYADSLS
jgi:ataxia telangiectasia mutated family protein